MPNVTISEQEQRDINIRSKYAQGDFVHLDDRVRHFVNTTIATVNDPSFSGFRLYFHFARTSGLLANENYPNSALAYLRRLGDANRYELLKTFIEELSRLNSEYGWMMQSISGLETVYAREFKTIALYDTEITISCYESIEYRIQALMEMYRKIVFDHRRLVYVLPSNLQKFSMSIYVYDIRVFWTNQTWLQSFDNVDVVNCNHICFDLGSCYFKPTSNSNFVSSLSNIDNATPAEGSFVIGYQTSDVSSLFSTLVSNNNLNTNALDLALTSAEAGQSTTNRYDKLFTRLKPAIARITDSVGDILNTESWRSFPLSIRTEAEELLVDQVEAGLNRLYLGNIYGASLSTIDTVLTDVREGSLDQALQLANRVDANTRSLGNQPRALTRYTNIR